MKLLLDTHVLLWWLSDDRRLSRKARELIAAPDNTVFYSAATIWELRIKQAIDKIVLPKNFDAVLDDQAFEALSITVAHAHALRALPLHHRDPFDRMLIAQAHEDGLTFVTHDEVVTKYSTAHILV